MPSTAAEKRTIIALEPYLHVLPAATEPTQNKRGKKKGQKSEVFPYEVDELRNMLNHFATNNEWIHYLLLTFGCNMARRCGDTLTLRWEHIFNPDTGNFRNDLLEIVEDKTDKLACPHINRAVKEAVVRYVKETGCDPAQNGYKGFIFVQPTGTHRGKLLTEAGHLKALKRAAKAVGIEKNIGTHSARKTFGMMNRRLHPNDHDSMELLRDIFNHADVATTSRYIGLTKEKTDSYYDDMGDFYADYIVEGKEIEFGIAAPVITIDSNDIRSILAEAYKMGYESAGNNDPMAAVSAMNKLLKLVEEKMK